MDCGVRYPVFVPCLFWPVIIEIDFCEDSNSTRSAALKPTNDQKSVSSKNKGIVYVQSVPKSCLLRTVMLF